MTSNETTPCSVFFDAMKRQGGISYKEMAAMVLSGRPLSDGRSPVSRASDRSWISRFIVHAPAGTLQDAYFSEYSMSALRIVSRLKNGRGRNLNSQKIIDIITGPTEQQMIDALKRCNQDTSLYKNVMARVIGETSFTIDERAEIAMVFFLSTACSADVRKSAATTLEFSRSIHGKGMATPMETPDPETAAQTSGISGEIPSDDVSQQTTFGLLRLTNGLVVGSPHWLVPSESGTVIGSIALDDEAITDVGVDVSGRHALIRLNDEDAWVISGLGSRNGTYVISGLDGSTIEVEKPAAERVEHECVDQCLQDDGIELHPGDEIVLGSSTHFVVIEGMPIL